MLSNSRLVNDRCFYAIAIHFAVYRHGFQPSQRAIGMLYGTSPLWLLCLEYRPKLFWHASWAGSLRMESAPRNNRFLIIRGKYLRSLKKMHSSRNTKAARDNSPCSLIANGK
jgi:hypothetical protein